MRRNEKYAVFRQVGHGHALPRRKIAASLFCRQERENICRKYGKSASSSSPLRQGTGITPAPRAMAEELERAGAEVKVVDYLKAWADRRRIARESAQGKFGSVRVHSVGFTDRVELYMAASDAIVTKMGGISATECINVGLPIVAAAKLLPQQEADNAVYLREKDAALLYTNERELRERLTALLTDEALRGACSRAQRSLAGGGDAGSLPRISWRSPLPDTGNSPTFRACANGSKPR